MKESDKIGVVFVNSVIGRGILNNVVNLSFGVYNFTPNEENGKVDIDHTVACRLRMDTSCFKQLRDVINELYAMIEQTEATPPKVEGIAKAETAH